MTGILYPFNKYFLIHSIHKWVWMNPNLLSLNHHKFIFFRHLLSPIQKLKHSKFQQMFMDSWEKLRCRYQIISIALRLTSSPGYVVPDSCAFLEMHLALGAGSVCTVSTAFQNKQDEPWCSIEYVQVCDLLMFFGKLAWTHFAFLKMLLILGPYSISDNSNFTFSKKWFRYPVMGNMSKENA